MIIEYFLHFIPVECKQRSLIFWGFGVTTKWFYIRNIMRKDGPPCSLGYDEKTNSLLVDRRDGVSNEVKKLLDQFYPKPTPAPPVAKISESPAPAAVESKADIKPLQEKLLQQEIVKFVGRWKLISASEKNIKIDDSDGMEFRRHGDELEATVSQRGVNKSFTVTLTVSDTPERIRRIKLA